MTKENPDKEQEQENSITKPFSGEIMFHPIHITTLIVKNGLIIGYNQK